jgi:hypothetical protein
MKTTVTPTGEIREDGSLPVAVDLAFKVEVAAEGHRREDGLTAAQVRQEIKEREGADGS